MRDLVDWESEPKQWRASRDHLEKEFGGYRRLHRTGCMDDGWAPPLHSKFEALEDMRFPSGLGNQFLPKGQYEVVRAETCSGLGHYITVRDLGTNETFPVEIEKHEWIPDWRAIRKLPTESLDSAAL